MNPVAMTWGTQCVVVVDHSYSTSTRKRPRAGAVGPAAVRLRAARMVGMASGEMRLAACFDEGADEVADHVVEEAGAGDAVDEEVFVLMPGGVVDGAGEAGSRE